MRVFKGLKCPVLGVLMIGIGTSLMGQRLHAANTKSLAGSLEKLATGNRINRGKDDPAGLITSENFRAVLAALDAEVRTVQRVDAVANVADGAMAEISSLLIEAKGLAVASANTAGMSTEEIQANQMQLNSIMSSINRITGSTNFNGNALLDGSASFTVDGETLNIGSTQTSNLGETIVDGQTFTLADLSSGGSLNLVNGNLEAASQAISNALSQISSQRGSIGAYQKNTLGSMLSSKKVTIENIAAANSSIRDTDYAKETAALIKSQLLVKSSAGVLALMNSINKQSMLNLLA